MWLKRESLGLTVAALTVSSLTIAAGTDQTTLSNEAQKAFREKAAQTPMIERVIEIEAEKIRAIRSVDGRTMYMVDNGRFVFVGDMFDLWQKKRLSSMDEIAHAVRTIDLKGAGFDIEHANKFSLGKGADHVTVFVDPLCGWCHRLLDEVAGDKALLASHTFDFIVIPVLGTKSEQLARRFACTSETDPMKRFKAFAAGEEGIETLPLKDGCDDVRYRETTRAADILGIQSAPMIVASDGRFARGKPKSIAAFLDGSESDGGKDVQIRTPKSTAKVTLQEAKAESQAIKEKVKAEMKAAALQSEGEGPSS